MSDILYYLVSFVAGALLGLIFFVGLWWTIQKGINSPRPALWFLGSMAVRTGLILAGFYFIAQGQWPRLVMCVLGFVEHRFLVMKRLAPHDGSPDSLGKGGQPCG